MQGHFSELLYLNKLNVVTEREFDKAISEIDKQTKLSYNIISLIAPLFLTFILMIFLFIENFIIGILFGIVFVLLLLYSKKKIDYLKKYTNYDSMFLDLVYTSVVDIEECNIQGKVYDKKYYNVILEGFDGKLKVSSSLPFANELFIGAPIVAMSEGIDDVSGIAGMFISEKFVEDSELEEDKEK